MIRFSKLLIKYIHLFSAEEIKSGTYKNLTKRERLIIQLTPGLRGLYISQDPKSMNKFLKSKQLGWLYD